MAIEDLIDDQREPLIVQEIKLRHKYRPEKRARPRVPVTS